MDLNKIEYFFKAAQLENFTKAAQACNIAQTTMSKYISNLEQELGSTLFLRSHQKAELTAKGKEFYSGMEKIADQYRELCQEIRRDRDMELRIGMITSDYADFPVLRSFEQEFPQYVLYFSFGTEKKLAEDLRRHKIDGLICPKALLLDHSREEIKREEILSARGLLICSGKLLERLGSLEAVIREQPLITKTEEKSYHEFCQRELQKLYGVSFRKTICVQGLAQQLLMVNLSNGFAIIPDQPGICLDGAAVFELPDIFREVSQLRFHAAENSPVLEKLIAYMHEKGC